MPKTQIANKTTPMMAQWHACKEQAGDALLLFRMGDFYEAFYQDAVTLSETLDLTLTKRQEIPMAGVPWHSGASYIDRLVAKGFRVAIAEQTEDPAKAKGLVKREVVRIVTPGTILGSSLVPDKCNNFIAAISKLNAMLGLAVIDLSTGEFRVAEFQDQRELDNELYRLNPSELLTEGENREKWHFDHQMAYQRLTKHFQIHSLDGFGLGGMIAAINAAGALLAYLTDDLFLSVDHIAQISPYSTESFLALDQTTQRNLELDLLLNVLDKTRTAMGGRLLRNWLNQPLLSVSDIEERQERIETLVNSPSISKQLSDYLGLVRDLERLMTKISSGIATPRDLVAVRISCEQLPAIRSLVPDPIEDLSDIATLIGEAIDDEGYFLPTYNTELAELQTLSKNSKAWLADYQVALRDETGIKTLKVGYNRVFGYYIEVSRGQSERVPETFHRRQTLTNSERFIDPKLKEYETKVLTAEERLNALEQKLFRELCEKLSAEKTRILKVAKTLARIDCLNSLAQIARARNYTRPTVDDSHNLVIEAGRHPVVEEGPTSFIPNDATLDALLIITGPNMAGKSTYIRQVAIITIMAQMGSFVPATSAHIGLVDKVFTRIGASDDLSRGQSTFMVEMTETANILNNATPRSLIILDEIGRGTSTFDGVSIAWAVAEHLLDLKARTLFATHYYELTELKGAVNYNVAVQENRGDIIFLHKIIPGSADKSYGIHVGRLAGLPLTVITRAQEILNHLEGTATKDPLKAPRRDPSQVQLSLF